MDSEAMKIKYPVIRLQSVYSKLHELWAVDQSGRLIILLGDVELVAVMSVVIAMAIENNERKGRWTTPYVTDQGQDMRRLTELQRAKAQECEGWRNKEE